MRTLNLLSTVSIGIALSATAQAQFSVSGGGSAVPASGLGGGMWDQGMPTAPGTSTVNVPEAVTTINSVVLEGFSHDWGGDVHVTLVDPNGVEHNLFLRPGFQNPAGADFGTPGDFESGDYTIVESGGDDLPTVANGADIAPGTYNQSFSTGGVSWTDGTNNIFNTPMGAIAGPAGDWELRIYDWGVGDNGSFSGWTLTGNQEASDNAGASDCDCSGGNSPCSNVSGAGRGCPNSNANGLGAALVGAGNADTTSDTFSLSLTDAAPNKPGLILSGTASLGPNGIATVPDSAGILCVAGQTRRGAVVLTDAAGAASFPDFQGAPYSASDIVSSGAPTSYTYWFRDPGTSAGCNGDTGSSDFNFTNGWTVTWL